MLSETLAAGLEDYHIGQKIRTLRQNKKLALVQLGEHTGLSSGADSDEVARSYRFHLARDSEMMSPTVPISNRRGTRAFQHVDVLTLIAWCGQAFWVCFERVRRRLSPVSSIRWAL